MYPHTVSLDEDNDRRQHQPKIEACDQQRGWKRTRYRTVKPRRHYVFRLWPRTPRVLYRKDALHGKRMCFLQYRTHGCHRTGCLH